MTRFWRFRSRVQSDRRHPEREIDYDNRTSIVHAISRQTAEMQHHNAAEVIVWRRQIRANWWLNWITLAAAIIAIGTVMVLIYTLIDARKATVEANRAWVAPRTAFLRRALVLNDHPAFRIVYDNVGKEPALNLSMLSQVIIVDAAALIRSLGQPNYSDVAMQENSTCAHDTIHQGAEIIWPSSRPEGYSNSSMENSDDPVITQEVLDGRQAIVIKGCFLYETFHEIHRSAFCFFFRQVPPDILTTRSGAVICTFGHEAN